MPEAQQDDKMAKAHPLVGVAESIDPDNGPRTAEEHRRSIEREYGEYVAVQPITHDGARAYNVGDAVPAANVEQWDYLTLGLVARRTTKAAAAAKDAAAGEPSKP